MIFIINIFIFANLKLTIMKRSILIIALMSLFLCSCDKDNVDLTESVPGIEGSWKWELSSSNGCFWYLCTREESGADYTLIFEEGNLLSIKDGDEFVIYQEELKVTKPTNIPQGPNSGNIPANEYLIELPKKTKYLDEYFLTNDTIYMDVDGYVSICFDEYYNANKLTIRRVEHDIELQRSIFIRQN